MCIILVLPISSGGQYEDDIYAGPYSGTEYLTRAITNVQQLNFIQEATGYSYCSSSLISNLTLIANPY